MSSKGLASTNILPPFLLLALCFLLQVLDSFRRSTLSDTFHKHWLDAVILVVSFFTDWLVPNDGQSLFKDFKRPMTNDSIGLCSTLLALFMTSIPDRSSTHQFHSITSKDFKLAALLAVLLYLSLRFTNNLTFLGLVVAFLTITRLTSPSVAAHISLLVCLPWLMPRSFSMGEAFLSASLISALITYLTSIMNVNPQQLAFSSPLAILMACLTMGTFWALISVTLILQRPTLPSLAICLISCFGICLLRFKISLWDLKAALLNLGNITTCIRWIGLLMFVLCSTSVMVRVLRHPTRVQHQLSRKFYHFIVTLIFIPDIVYNRLWLCFCSISVAQFFILIEVYRLKAEAKSTGFLTKVVSTFRNSLDSGEAVLSPLWLLIGCTIPVIAAGGANNSDLSLQAASGVLVLGVLDGMAAPFGVQFGRHRWPNSPKTLEGSIAGALAYFISQLLFLYYYYDVSSLFTTFAIACRSLVCMVWEATCDQNDNITLPLVAFIAASVL